MCNVDILKVDQLSIEELEKVITQASEEIEKRRREEAAAVRNKIRSILEDSGLSLTEVFKSKNPRKGRKVPMQFQNPDNPSEQWSGRGRMPVWMREKIDQTGGAKEDYRIPGTES